MLAGLNVSREASDASLGKDETYVYQACHDYPLESQLRLKWVWFVPDWQKAHCTYLKRLQMDRKLMIK